MKTFRIGLTFVTFFLFAFINAQEKNNHKTEESKVSYYKNRAKEDAKFEQQYKADSKKEEKQFWKEQKAYEKELKRRDEIAYKAYMQGKRDAYYEHSNHCNHSCNHGHYYHNHATFYYHYEYRRTPSYRSRTNVNIGLPRVRIGLF